MQWYIDEFEKKATILLYTVLVTRYGPQISCQRNVVKIIQERRVRLVSFKLALIDD